MFSGWVWDVVSSPDVVRGGLVFDSHCGLSFISSSAASAHSSSLVNIYSLGGICRNLRQALTGTTQYRVLPARFQRPAPPLSLLRSTYHESRWGGVPLDSGIRTSSA